MPEVLHPYVTLPHHHRVWPSRSQVNLDTGNVSGRYLGPTDVFADSFSTNPAANGWTEVTENENQTISSDGERAIFARTLNGSQFDASIARTLDLSGYESAVLEVRGSQIDTAFEVDDYFKVEVDAGSGFTELAKDNGRNRPVNKRGRTAKPISCLTSSSAANRRGQGLPWSDRAG